MFTNALRFIKGLLGSLGTVAPILGAFGVVFPPAAIAGIPIAIGLMTAAEEAFGDGSGPVKKAAVTAGLTAFTEAMANASTGGQKETWAAFTPEVVSATIDVIATTANQIAAVAGGVPVFDDSVFERMKIGGYTA